MRSIKKHGQIVELTFGFNGLPGYKLMADHDIVVPSVFSNKFFKEISLVNLPKKMKGFRSNPELSGLLAPISVETGVTIELQALEYIILELDPKLSNDDHLLLISSVNDGKDIVFDVINVGINDVFIKSGEVIGTAMISQGLE